jgi:hypothetical protein
MKLYIKIQNGQPAHHPVEEGNLKNAHPHIDVHNLPPDWAPFQRVQQPHDLLAASPFLKAVCTYVLSSDGVTWQDSWAAQPMDAQEVADKIALYQADPPGPNHTLDHTTLVWSPSTPMPQDGQKYLWNRIAGQWIVPPVKPADGQLYSYDFNSNTWVVVPPPAAPDPPTPPTCQPPSCQAT